jgi:hypothetical protein
MHLTTKPPLLLLPASSASAGAATCFELRSMSFSPASCTACVPWLTARSAHQRTWAVTLPRRSDWLDAQAMVGPICIVALTLDCAHWYASDGDTNRTS